MNQGLKLLYFAGEGPMNVWHMYIVHELQMSGAAFRIPCLNLEIQLLDQILLDIAQNPAKIVVLEEHFDDVV